MKFRKHEQLTVRILSAIGVFLVLYVLVSVFLESFSWTVWVAAILALCLVYLANRIGMRPDNRQRRECLSALMARPPGNLPQEYAIVTQRGRVPREDVERLWTGLATFYDVSPNMLRAADVLKDELAGMMGHLDYDPFFCVMIISHKGPAQDTSEKVHDWADLIICFYQFEQESGKLGTKRVKRDGEDRWIWDGDGSEIATNHCQYCAYNLTGNTSGICPECGTPIPKEVPEKLATMPPRGNIRIHTHGS